jgi:hypothetical protein
MAKRIHRTAYRDRTSPGNVRPGAATRSEVGLDQENYFTSLIQSLAAFNAPGVATGMRAHGTAGHPEVVVTPGVALDSFGRLIILSESGHAEVGASPDAPGAAPQLALIGAEGVTISTAGRTVPCLLVIQAWETFDDQAFTDSGTLRVEHTPWIQLLEAVPGMDPLAPDDAQVKLATVLFSQDGSGNVESVIPLRHPRIRFGEGQMDGLEFRRKIMTQPLESDQVALFSPLFGNVASFSMKVAPPGLLLDTQNVRIDGNLEVTGFAAKVRILGDLEVTGQATFHGPKVGFLVDAFRNSTDQVLSSGDVVVVADAVEAGALIPVPHVRLAAEAYDSRACGIVNQGAVPGESGQMVTLGCWRECKVDADISPIAAGDLLTTSATPGHAQKVVDRARAVGAIIGKALAPLASGKGLVPVLVSLH